VVEAAEAYQCLVLLRPLSCGCNRACLFRGRLDKHQISAGERDLHITLGFIPRKLGKQDLMLSASELAQAELLSPGWQPRNWSIDTAARVAVLCCYADCHPQHFERVLLDLFRTADVAESIAYYSGVALFPQSDGLDKQIADGLRSNMRSVFESIAHNKEPMQSLRLSCATMRTNAGQQVGWYLLNCGAVSAPTRRVPC